jgi:hypothetical protein
VPGVTDGSSVDGASLQHFERQLLENYPWLAVVMAVLLAAPYADTYEGDPRHWDWLLISGILVFLVTYPLSLRFPDQVVAALRQLQGQGILQPEEAMGAFENRLNRSANRWAGVGGFVFAGVMGSVWLIAFVGVLQYPQYTIGFTVPGAIVEMVLSIAAGRFIGRGLCYGTLASRLPAEGITLCPIPDHSDGVAGLGLVGRIYFAQAMLVASIAAFLGVWIILLPVFGPQYSVWRLPYILLLILMLALEVASLLWPLHAFNRILLEWKQKMLRDAPASRARMDEDGIVSSEQRQRFLREHRNRIERMPTWVLDTLARWFLVGVNVLLAAPLLLISAGLIPA